MSSPSMIGRAASEHKKWTTEHSVEVQLKCRKVEFPGIGCRAQPQPGESSPHPIHPCRLDYIDESITAV